MNTTRTIGPKTKALKAAGRTGWQVALTSLTVGALATACVSVGSNSAGHVASPTGGEPAPPASPTASAAIPCKQITSLRTALTQMSGLVVTVRQVAALVPTAQHELAALAGQAGALSAQATELRAELGEVGKDAQAFSVHSSSADMAALRGAIGKLKNQAQPLIREMQAVCPNS